MLNTSNHKETKQNFISEKKKYDTDMEKELVALRQRQEEEQEVAWDSGRNVAEKLVFMEENELTEHMKDKLIEKVMMCAQGRI